MLLNILLLTLATCCAVNALENGLARTPPMGWMHWERFRCIIDCEKYPNECISENLFKRIADALVDEGYAAAGYEYVIIDDCWLEKERDSVTKKLVPDRKRFPSGLKALADYIHGKGLKFGLYQDYGTKTCAGYPGIINHMELDAKTFAEWDVDYVKVDGCNANPHTMDKGYPEFGRYLNETGRPMVYSCSWPAYQSYTRVNYELIKEHCNLWRNEGDIQDSYKIMMDIVGSYNKKQDKYQPNAGPGHWNDPDMLILGNFGLSYEQSKTQMAIWTVLAAPLIMSNDLATVRPEIKEILQNRDIININQDPLGIQGRLLKRVNGIEIYTRPITPVKNDKYSYAVAFVSRRTDQPTAVAVNVTDLGLDNPGGYSVLELFEHKSLANLNAESTFETRVNPTGVNFYKFTAQ